MKRILYPFVFFLSWYFWLAGHISYLLLQLWDNDLWVDLFFTPYQGNMLASSDLQDWVDGRGWLWPWGEPIDHIDQ